MGPAAVAPLVAVQAGEVGTGQGVVDHILRQTDTAEKQRSNVNRYGASKISVCPDLHFDFLILNFPLPNRSLGLNSNATNGSCTSAVPCRRCVPIKHGA